MLAISCVSPTTKVSLFGCYLNPSLTRLFMLSAYWPYLHLVHKNAKRNFVNKCMYTVQMNVQCSHLDQIRLVNNMYLYYFINCF